MYNNTYVRLEWSTHSSVSRKWARRPATNRGSCGIQWADSTRSERIFWQFAPLLVGFCATSSCNFQVRQADLWLKTWPASWICLLDMCESKLGKWMQRSGCLTSHDWNKLYKPIQLAQDNVCMDWRSVALYSDHKLSPFHFHFHFHFHFISISISNLPVSRWNPSGDAYFWISNQRMAPPLRTRPTRPCSVRLWGAVTSSRRHVGFSLGDAGAAVESQCVGCAEFQT